VGWGGLIQFDDIAVGIANEDRLRANMSQASDRND
jgi:hypothetical protein